MIRENVDVIAVTVLILGFAILSQAGQVLKVASTNVNARVTGCERIDPVVRAVTLPFIRASE